MPNFLNRKSKQKVNNGPEIPMKSWFFDVFLTIIFGSEPLKMQQMQSQCVIFSVFDGMKVTERGRDSHKLIDNIFFSVAKLRIFFRTNTIKGVDNLQMGFVYFNKQKRFLEVDNFSLFDRLH